MVTSTFGNMHLLKVISPRSISLRPSKKKSSTCTVVEHGVSPIYLIELKLGVMSKDLGVIMKF